MWGRSWWACCSRVWGRDRKACSVGRHAQWTSCGHLRLVMEHWRRHASGEWGETEGDEEHFLGISCAFLFYSVLILLSFFSSFFPPPFLLLSSSFPPPFLLSPLSSSSSFPSNSRPVATALSSSGRSRKEQHLHWKMPLMVPPTLRTAFPHLVVAAPWIQRRGGLPAYRKEPCWRICHPATFMQLPFIPLLIHLSCARVLLMLS